jgi:RNA polymerase sigma-70 factor (ECF subfamily)
MPARGSEIEALLAQADWLRALATHLVRTPADAEDLVQETFVAALRKPPDAARPPRPWLAEVVRNLARMGARGGARRRARETSSSIGAPGAAEAADAALERMELHRELAGLVMALEEPYRTAVLLRFFEGREPAEIAEALGVAGGTVRWRVSEGVRRLRERLDERHAGAGWRLVLLPLVHRSEGGGPPIGRAVIGKTAMLAGAVAVAGAGALIVSPSSRQPPPERATSSLTAGRSGTSDSPADQRTKEDRVMNEAMLKKTVILFGLVLPTLAMAGEADKPLPREEAIKTCVWYKEMAVQCRNELADFFATFAKPGTPPEVLARYRAKALKEILDEGTGPLQPRREKCSQDVEKRPITYGDLATLKKCAAQTNEDCKAAIECANAFAKRGKAEKK